MTKHPVIKKCPVIRHYPKAIGTVVRVPLPEGTYAYLCNYGCGTDYWLFNFVTDKPVANSRFFNPNDWLEPVQWSDLLPTCRDVVILALTKEQKSAVSFYKRLDHMHPLFRSRIIVRDGKTGLHRGGTEEEIVGMRIDKWYYYDEIIPWIIEQRSRMRLVQVAEEDVDRETDLIPVEKREGVLDGRQTLIEISVRDPSPKLFTQRENLEAEMLDKLAVAQCTDGGATDHGSIGVYYFDIAVTVDTKRFKTALGVIRKVLLKYKVPETLLIRAFRDDLEDWTEHPLIAPPKAKS